MMLTLNKIAMAVLVFVAMLFAGCATNLPIGAVYTDLTLPLQATNENGTPSKVGRASCVSYVAMVAQGDCSIDAAKRDGGITEVHHVDWKANSLLGIIGRYEVIVYGE